MNLSLTSVSVEHETQHWEPIPFWDVSDHPLANQPFKKFGAGAAQRGAAIAEWGDATQLRRLANGLRRLEASANSKSPHSDFPIQPESFALRLTSSDGQNDLSCWAVRLTVDQSNPHSSRQNMGTMVTDYAGSQAYGWTNDVWRLTGIAAAVADRELAFNGAAYLGMLYPDGKGGGIMARNALATEISKNLGFVADSKRVAQWAHILTLIQKSAGGKGTRAGKAKAQGDRPDEKAELGLLHRTPFKLPGGGAVTMPKIEGAPKSTVDDGDETAVVHFGLGDPNPQQPDLEENKLSNHEAIPITPWPQLIAWTKRKKSSSSPYPSESHHYDDSYHGTPPGKTGDGSTPTDGGESRPTITDTDPLATPKLDMVDGTETGVTTVEDGQTLTQVEDGNGYKYFLSYFDEVPPSDLSKQVDQGHEGPESPGFIQRTNTHRYHKSRDVVAAWNEVKPPTFTTVHVRLQLKLSDMIAPDEWIVFTLSLLARSEEGAKPTAIYGIDFWLTHGFFAKSHPARIDVLFKGFPTQRQVLEVHCSRNAYNPVDVGVQSRVELHRPVVSFFWENPSDAPGSGYGFGYGLHYGQQL